MYRHTIPSKSRLPREWDASSLLCLDRQLLKAVEHCFWAKMAPKRYAAVMLFVMLMFQGVGAFKVTGVTSTATNISGLRPFRRDIEEFSQSGAAFDLYIQALNEFQRMDQDDPLSYYQVAGKYS